MTDKVFEWCISHMENNPTCHLKAVILHGTDSEPGKIYRNIVQELFYQDSLYIQLFKPTVNKEFLKRWIKHEVSEDDYAEITISREDIQKIEFKVNEKTNC